MNSSLQTKIVGIIRSSPHSGKIGKIYLFGSCARGEETATSDIDLMVELKEPMGWEFYDLQDELEKKVNKKVDLWTTDLLRGSFGAAAHQDKILIAD